MDSARHAQAGLQIRVTRTERSRPTFNEVAPAFDEFYSLSLEMRDQLAKQKKKKEELKQLADIRKVLSSLEVKRNPCI